MAEDDRPEEGLPGDGAAPPPPVGGDDQATAETAALPVQPDDEAVAGETAAAASGGLSTGAKVAIGVAAALVAIYLIAVLWSAGGVPSNTVVAGVQIGGLSEQEAAATMEAELAEIAVAPITYDARGSETVAQPADFEMSPNYRETADIASGPIFNPVRLFQHITGQDVEVAPIVNVNEELLAEGLVKFGATADEPAVEPTITMSAQEVTLERGASGEGIDQEPAADLVVASYLFTTGPIDLPITALEPTVSDEEAERVLNEYALPAISGPVKLTFDGSSDTLQVETIGAGLSFAPEDGMLMPQLNVEVVRAGLPVLAETEDPGTDATWDVSSGKPVVVPSKQGSGVADEELTSEILAVLPNTVPAERAATLEIVATDPDLTTAQAEALNITEQLSSFTQPFDYAEYREVNVGQAAEYMDGWVMKPGDTFSMNETILERTKANGYTSGTYISGGRFQEGLGGGVSIATTAAWTGAFFAGMEAIEVNPHSLYISRYQPGLEATVAWGLLDLKFRNNSDNGVLITTEAGPTFITVNMWGTKKYDDIYDVSSDRYNITSYPTEYDSSGECSSQGGANGFTIDVWRVFENGGQEVDREKFTTRYDPTTRYVCSPPPQPAPTPTQTPSPDGGSRPPSG